MSGAPTIGARWRLTTCQVPRQPRKAPAYIEELKRDQDVRRERFLQNQDKTELLSLEEARKYRFQTNWSDISITL